MVASMTAFGRAGSDLVDWEIRSVNHRYLELGFRLPEPLRGLEQRLRELISGRIRRGKVDATLRLAEAEIAPQVNAKAVGHLLDAALAIRAQSGDALGAVSPVELMRFPGVLTTDGDMDAIRTAALDLFSAAVDDLVRHREREGAGLAAALCERLAEVERIVDTLGPLTGTHADHMRDRLRERVDALAVRVDEARFEQEVALLAQKADVAEEIDRLAIHVAEARASLLSREPCGRRLDFLMQEFSREANTLAAKSILPEAARLAVDLKVVIEQMREQVQNVE